MTAIDCVPEDLQKFSEQLVKTQTGLLAILEELDQAVKTVEGKWGGDAHQTFIRFYRDWRKGVEMHSSALKNTSEHLQKMVEEYQKIR